MKQIKYLVRETNLKRQIYLNDNGKPRIRVSQRIFTAVSGWYDVPIDVFQGDLQNTIDSIKSLELSAENLHITSELDGYCGCYDGCYCDRDVVFSVSGGRKLSEPEMKIWNDIQVKEAKFNDRHGVKNEI